MTPCMLTAGRSSPGRRHRAQACMPAMSRGVAVAVAAALFLAVGGDEAYERPNVCVGEADAATTESGPKLINFRTNCTADVLDGHSAFRLPVPRYETTDLGKLQQQVNLVITVTDELTVDGESCGENCLSEESARIQALVGYGRSWTPFDGCGARNIQVGLQMAVTLMCFPVMDAAKSTSGSPIRSGHVYTMPALTDIHTSKDMHTSNMTVSVLPSMPVSLAVFLQLTTIELQNHSKIGYPAITGFLGGSRGTSKIFAIDIADPYASYELIALTVERKNVRLNQTKRPVNAYVFGENACINPYIEQGGCVNPLAVHECLNSGRLTFNPVAGWRQKVGQHASFIDDVNITLSGASEPPRSTGRFFILVTCATDFCEASHEQDCPLMEITIEHKPEYGPEWMLLKGLMFMIFAPMVFLAVVDAWVHVVHYVLRRSCGIKSDATVVWPAYALGRPSLNFLAGCLKRFKQHLTDPSPFLPSFLALMLGTFISTAGQFVITHWYIMERTGDHDVCFYNEDCYYPFRGSSMPLNHIISNIPYVIAGMHLVLQTIYAEHLMDLCDATCTCEIRGPRVNLRPFFGIACAIMSEGVGSSFYHVCPSIETFQFDTCFMIPIAHLFCLALAAWPENSQKAALQYFIYIICPIWMFSFIGTWYDIKVASMDGDGKTGYDLFCVAMVAWALCAVQAFNVLLPDSLGCGGKVMRLTMKALCAAAVASFTVPAVREAFDGTANAFLTLSIVVMVVVLGRQIYDIEIRHLIKSRSAFLLVLIMRSCSYLLVMVVVWIGALRNFADKTVIVLPGTSAAESHAVNKPCTFEVFDVHDLWHLGSAMGIAVMSMFLLDVKLNSFLTVDRGLVVGKFGSDDEDDESSAEEDDEQSAP